MIKVMIADDEKVAIDSLKFIIEKNFSNLSVISTVRSGRQAIEQVEETMPDIIFMDIRMPGINGLEAIREIRSRYKNIVIIVLTAFDNFEFAKEAVNLGVMEYLLKPAKRTKIVDVLNKAIRIIVYEKEKRKADLEMKEKLEYISPIVENGFIYSILLFDENRKELLNYQRLFDNKKEGGYIITFERDNKDNQEDGEKSFQQDKEKDYYSYFKDIAKSMVSCVVGPSMMNRIVIYIHMEETKDHGLIKSESITFSENLARKISEKFQGDVKIGIGKAYNTFEMLANSYEESLQSLRYIEKSGVLHFTDIGNLCLVEKSYPKEKERLMFEKVVSGDVIESINAFNYIFDWLALEYDKNPLKIKDKILEILFLINGISKEYGDKAKENETSLLEEILLIMDSRELQLWSRRIIENHVSKIYVYRDYKVGSLIKKAKIYIKTNYSKYITLEDVAIEINVSPQYLSKLFKEETGENFIDYLTSIRIKIAKELLENNCLNIKEICYSIGYNNPNYFSKIFKKTVGVTPTEYKEKLINSSQLQL